jgi:Protein of unknown function (DUF3052)
VRDEELELSATAGGADTSNAGARMGFGPGSVVQELGWDDDVDDQVRVQIEDAIDGDMVDGDYGNVVDAVVLWWRGDDGDLVDALVDALTDLASGGPIWLLTPKVGRPNAVDAADVTEAAPVAGLSVTTTTGVSQDWSATRLVAPRGQAR